MQSALGPGGSRGPRRLSPPRPRRAPLPSPLVFAKRRDAGPAFPGRAAQRALTSPRGCRDARANSSLRHLRKLGPGRGRGALLEGEAPAPGAFAGGAGVSAQPARRLLPLARGSSPKTEIRELEGDRPLPGVSSLGHVREEGRDSGVSAGRLAEHPPPVPRILPPQSPSAALARLGGPSRLHDTGPGLAA